MAEGAAIKDKPTADPPKDHLEASHPLVSRQDVAAHQTTVAKAREATAPKIVDGHLDCSQGTCYQPEAGGKSVAQGADATALSTKTPQSSTDTTASKARPETAALDRAARENDGADAARRLQAQTGDKPPTRSDKITYTATEQQEKDLQASKANLIAAEGKMSAKDMPPEMKAAMAKSMDDLEHRKPAATPEQIKGVYDATARLLNNEGGKNPPVLNDKERGRLANDILSNAAQQHEIDQGNHNTCNVTTLEETLNRQSPDKAAELVSQVGLTGEYKSPSDGKIIKLDPKSLHPDGETNFDGSKTQDITRAKDGDRNYASQVFDMATINDYWQHQQPEARYSQTNNRDGQSDTGERLTYARSGTEINGPDGRPMREPGLGTAAMAQIGKDIGLQGDGYIVSTKEFQHNGRDGINGDDRVQSYEDFSKALEKNPTSIVFLNGRDKLFTGTEDKGGSSGGHVVTVSDFRKGPPDEVYMRNQWGSENNKWVSVAELYNASLPPDSPNKVSASGVPNKIERSVDGVHNNNDQKQPVSVGGDGRGTHGSNNGPDGSTWNRDYSHTMTDKEYNDWREQVKKEDSDPPKVKAPQKADIEGVQSQINTLQSQLQNAKWNSDDVSAANFEAQINALRATVAQ